MKTVSLQKSKITSALFSLLSLLTTNSQVAEWNTQLEKDSKEALQTMLEKKPELESYMDKSYGYVVFPKVSKAALSVGGAFGNGVVYKDHAVVGSSKLKQATIGYQFGVQQYIEVIFFEGEQTFEKFVNGKLKFDAQASVVAFKDGASFDVAYQDGVAVFTMTRGGLMYEASLGGQHFKYTPKPYTY